ncbi:MAG: hypothetical protein LBS35_12620 [Synergistaceae bacterium]|nr:hypothetical protein [Synergistaceae bacterium]
MKIVLYTSNGLSPFLASGTGVYGKIVGRYIIGFMGNWGFVYENLKSMLAALGDAENAKYAAYAGTAAFYDSGVDDAWL